MSSTEYSIEKAKSGRAKCQKCKEIILKEELRIGATVTPEEGHSMTRWYHPRCFTLPKKLQREGATVDSFVREDLVDDGNLLDEHLQQVVDDITHVVPKKKKEDTNDNTNDSCWLASIKKRAAATEQDDNDAHQPASKKVKREESTQEEQAVELYIKYKSFKNDDLKEMLRYNKQMLTGTKDLLLLRCIDGELRGRLPLCPMCTHGKLKIATAQDDFCACSGFYDEDMQTRIPECGYKIALDKAPRLSPFHTTKPTDEEQAAMDAANAGDSKTTGAGAAVGKEAVVAKLLEDAKAMDYKVSNQAEMKQTAKKIVELAKAAGLALPQEGPNKAVGKILIANGKTKDAAQIMQLAVDQFGFADIKKEAKKEKDDAIASQCACPANAPIVAMLKEYAQLCFASQDKFKGTANMKAAQAITGLDFQVTEENAMKLGKAGKLKVPGIGKSTAEKMFQFVTEGTVQALEDLRASVGQG